MEPIKKWYAVYTHAKWEKKVANLLARKEIENYCPLNRVLKQWSDRKKIVYEPLFTSYVFVRVSQKENISVLQTDGVLNYVNWKGKPALIRDSEIELIKNFLFDHSNVRLEKIAVEVNDTVRIKYGLFVEQEGRVTEVMDKTIRVLLPSLGYAMLAEIPKSHIEVINNRSKGNC
ncbi:UpxY family transcription antiterminator [Niastella caeni]|uniref:UpxY family transcription antiterminator n=1 Tax=Niastella caeni TaxID=2569763 RepID=A0A4S8HX43_9BACT|nr:UpxY family transcription antiterminator [Niastella caeni]THU40210.1 UpxY family transcription antiterminator [Niastella caeni]